MNWLMVFLGGGLGTVCRFALSLLLKDYTFAFPLPTLVANAIAALLIGVLYFLGVKSQSTYAWIFLATGFCGGLSTFSAFSLETFQLMRQGNTAMAFLNIFLNFLICLVLIYVVSKLWGSIAEQ